MSPKTTPSEASPSPSRPFELGDLPDAGLPAVSAGFTPVWPMAGNVAVRSGRSHDQLITTKRFAGGITAGAHEAHFFR